PVAVLLVAVLHAVPDDEGPHDFVARYRDIMAPGSHVAISHITSHEQPAHLVDRMTAVFEKVREPMVPRSRDEILRFFDGCELVDPGLVPAAEWRPDETAAEDDPPTGFILAGVGRKA
ncbi:MAG: hypothetical protein GEV09_28670, partial [Pseudonocardiaceae bacterium]|nr:hypothetical protein [Pseudonocardiaceae bacterium]